MERRAFLGALTSGLLAAPLTVEGVPAGKVPRIGFLLNGNRGSVSPERVAFLEGLHELGWIEGQTVAVEYRWAEGNPDRYPPLAAELVQRRVDVIVVAGPPAIHAVREASTTIPIVCILLADPVALGYAKSLARPGGNLTGLASPYEDLITKQLQLLHEAVPTVSRVALLHHRESWPAILNAAEAAALSLALTPRPLTVEGLEFESAFRVARNEHVGAAHVLPSPIFFSHRGQLIELTAKYRLPAVYELKPFVEEGGFMSYSPNMSEMFRGMASYVNRILKGARPADLPIEQPTKFEFVINLKTAKALGLTIPPSLLARADQVIE